MERARHYSDGEIECNDGGISIRHYYFPTGAKRIEWEDIRRVIRFEMRALSGQWRIWGTGDLRHWFNLDLGRPQKRVGFLIDKGGWVRAVVTPDDPEAFERALETHGIDVRDRARCGAASRAGDRSPPSSE